MTQAYVFKTEPYEHQLKALDKSCDKTVYAYFMEMGTGKSKVLIDNVTHLYNKGKINAVLVVAPKGVYRNWVNREIPIHLPDFIEKEIYMWTPSESNKELKLREELLNTNNNQLKFLVMNVEALSTDKGVRYAYAFISKYNTLMTVDESTTIKNPEAKRTRNVIKLGKYCHYRRILTGSPITKSPLDVYTQAQFLDPGLLGFPSYFAFRNRFALLADRVAGGRSFKQVVGFQNLNELKDLLKKFSYRVLKKDCLDLPDKVYVRREIEMTPEQKRIYNDIKKYAIAELSVGKVTAASVITQIIRLQQIACGFVSTTENVTDDIKNNRVDELLQILAETEGKVIIWANYRHDIAKLKTVISEIYGEDAVGTYYGDTSDEDRENIINKFQDVNSKLRYFVGNTQTGGYGITLTAASTVVYYSNNYDLEKRLQSEDRAHRIGQKNKVTYIDIVCKDTVDEKIVKALRSKLNIAQTVLGENKWKEWL